MLLPGDATGTGQRVLDDLTAPRADLHDLANDDDDDERIPAS